MRAKSDIVKMLFREVKRLFWWLPYPGAMGVYTAGIVAAQYVGGWTA